MTVRVSSGRRRRALRPLRLCVRTPLGSASPRRVRTDGRRGLGARLFGGRRRRRIGVRSRAAALRGGIARKRPVRFDAIQGPVRRRSALRPPPIRFSQRSRLGAVSARDLLRTRRRGRSWRAASSSGTTTPAPSGPTRSRSRPPTPLRRPPSASDVSGRRRRTMMMKMMMMMRRRRRGRSRRVKKRSGVTLLGVSKWRGWRMCRRASRTSRTRPPTARSSCATCRQAAPRRAHPQAEPRRSGRSA